MSVRLDICESGAGATPRCAWFNRGLSCQAKGKIRRTAEMSA